MIRMAVTFRKVQSPIDIQISNELLCLVRIENLCILAVMSSVLVTGQGSLHPSVVHRGGSAGWPHVWQKKGLRREGGGFGDGDFFSGWGWVCDGVGFCLSWLGVEGMVAGILEGGM